MGRAPGSLRTPLPFGLSSVPGLAPAPPRRADMPGMRRSLAQDPGAVLSALRPSLRLGSRARSLRALPSPASLLPPRAGGVSVPRRRPALPARAEIWGASPNRVGPRPPRGTFVGRLGRPAGGLSGDSRSALERPEAGARFQPGGAGGTGSGPRGGRTATSSSPRENQRTAAASGAIRGRAPDERRVSVPRAFAALPARKNPPPRRRRAHDRRDGRSRRPGPPRGGSGRGGRPHARAGSVRK